MFRLQKFLINNDILAESQHELKKGCPTLIALNLFMIKVFISLDTGELQYLQTLIKHLTL